jgi:hypothetical protein
MQLLLFYFLGTFVLVQNSVHLNVVRCIGVSLELERQ